MPKACIYPAAALAALLMSGCVKDHTAPQLDAQRGQNEWIVRDYTDAHVHAGVIAQATLYPHHFYANGATLNALGSRDVGILASHLREHPGRVNVRRGEADRALYNARLKTVHDALTAGGVADASIKLEDELPGGDGIAADRALYVIEQDTKPLSSAGSTRSISEGTGSIGGQPTPGATGGAP